MLRSIRETGKLFAIEGVKEGRINIKTSAYLLSLPGEKQIELLTSQMEDLKKDLARYESPEFRRLNSRDDVYKTQLQILIQVIEGLLDQI